MVRASTGKSVGKRKFNTHLENFLFFRPDVAYVYDVTASYTIYIIRIANQCRVQSRAREKGMRNLNFAQHREAIPN